MWQWFRSWKKNVHLSSVASVKTALVGGSDLAPLRTNPDDAKRCIIKIPEFYGLLSPNQGF